MTLNDIQRIGNEYFANPNSAHSEPLFLDSCQHAHAAKEVLIRHVEWDIILFNLAKAIANSVIYTLSVGYLPTFFPFPKVRAPLLWKISQNV